MPTVFEITRKERGKHQAVTVIDSIMVSLIELPHAFDKLHARFPLKDGASAKKKLVSVQSTLATMSGE